MLTITVLLVAMGITHGLGADHLAAVGLLVARRPDPREVAGLALRFGLGHGVVLIGMALLLRAFRWSLPASVETQAELLNGGLLLGLGAWLLWELANGRIRDLTEDHSGHAHGHLDDRHAHRHGDQHGDQESGVGPFVLGGLFAVSGVRSFLLAVLPVASTGSLAEAILGTLAFAGAIVVAMLAFGHLCTWGMRRIESRSGEVRHLGSWAAGLASVVTGAGWILSTVL